MELSEKLNDENVKIIDILAKDIILQVNNMKYEIKAYGLDVLMKCLKEKSDRDLKTFPTFPLK